MPTVVTFDELVKAVVSRTAEGVGASRGTGVDVGKGVGVGSGVLVGTTTGAGVIVAVAAGASEASPPSSLPQLAARSATDRTTTQESAPNRVGDVGRERFTLQR